MNTEAATFTTLQVRDYTKKPRSHVKNQTSNSLPLHESAGITSSSLTGEKGRRHRHALSESAAELLEQEADNTRGVYLARLTLSTLSKHPASTSIA